MKYVIPVTSFLLALFGFVAEFFGLLGCLFCWAQRFILLFLALSSWFEARSIAWRIASGVWLLLGLVLGLLQLHFLMGMLMGDEVCQMWWMSWSPSVLVPFLLSFPPCDVSGVWNIPWVVWLLMYYSAAAVFWMVKWRYHE